MRRKSRHLRKRSTPAEVILWEEIRNRKLGGLKFRRQYPVLGFILDYYCAEKSLGIELDGSIHDSQEEYDEWREKLIQEKGIRIVRFSNQEIVKNLEEVKKKILDFLIDKVYRDPHSTKSHFPSALLLKVL